MLLNNHIGECRPHGDETEGSPLVSTGGDCLQFTVINILFPEIELPQEAILGECLETPRRFIANPKAVALQTFASPAAFKIYLSSGLWQDAARLFSPQYAMTANINFNFSLEDNVAWLAFPWSVIPNLATSGTLVWLEEASGGQDVRHVRLYCSPDHAHQDNSWLQTTLATIVA